MFVVTEQTFFNTKNKKATFAKFALESKIIPKQCVTLFLFLK